MANKLEILSFFVNVIIVEITKILTVLLPRFRTLQLKYADLPTNAVTLFDTFVSKCGSFHFGFVIEFCDGYAVLASFNVL